MGGGRGSQERRGLTDGESPAACQRGELRRNGGHLEADWAPVRQAGLRPGKTSKRGAGNAWLLVSDTHWRIGIV